MPLMHDGGAAPPPPVAFPIVVADPVTGGTTVENTTGTAEQAIEQSGQILRIRTAPSLANLPSNPTLGRFYQFDQQPGTLYFISFDNVWRALIAVSVT